MKKHGTITGMLSFICIISFGSSTGVILLYNQGDSFSLFVVFLTLFCTSFFVSGIRDEINADIFFQDIIIGVVAVLFTGVMFLFGTYETMAYVSSIAIFAIIIFKVTRKSNLQQDGIDIKK